MLKNAQVSVGEDQFYPNTSSSSVQVENAEKQDFFEILAFIYGNLSSLW